MNINMNGITGSIHFMWDLNQSALDTMLAPLPEDPIDVSDYMGAVFFGKFKLEFIRNDVAGIYCNLFEYDAEDDPGHAYGYLEDGTPYEERYPVSDEIHPRNLPTLEAFTDDIDRQILLVLNNHPDLISSALHQISPNDWYPCNHPYTVTITQEA